MRMCRLAVVALLLLTPRVAAAQPLATNQPFSITWTHDGVDTTEYRVYTNATLTATVPLSALVNGTASYRFGNGLANGTYTLGVTAFGAGGESNPSTVVAVVAAPSGPNPPGSVTLVPDAQTWYVQAEDFGTGGEGVSYHDLDGSNTGGVYRQTGVDIETCSDVNGGFDVGWAFAGEWLRYTVNVATTGTYDLSVRVASAGPGGTFHLEVNGVNVTGPLIVPNTGGWQTWTTLTKSVALVQGNQDWRLMLDTNGATTAVGNFNWIGATFKTP